MYAYMMHVRSSYFLIFLFSYPHDNFYEYSQKNTVTEPMIKVLESGNKKYRTDEEQEGVAKLIEMLSWLSGAGEKK